jgi:hypothetical protein
MFEGTDRAALQIWSAMAKRRQRISFSDSSSTVAASSTPSFLDVEILIAV